MKGFDDDDFFLPTLRGEVDAFFRNALSPSSPGALGIQLWNPQVDVTEEDDRFILEADLPGVRREDIAIEVRGRTLHIAGHRRIVRRTMGRRFSHCERVSGSFRRAVPLPRDVDGEGITAALEEGILRLELPKKGTPR